MFLFKPTYFAMRKTGIKKNAKTYFDIKNKYCVKIFEIIKNR